MSTIETIALAAGGTAVVEIGSLALLWASFAYRDRRGQRIDEASKSTAK